MNPKLHSLIITLALFARIHYAHAQGTAFTYQGRLNSGGAVANGSYDVQFTLFTTNITGIAIAGPVTNTAVAVTNGLFTTLVNFGPGAFTGTSNWLAIAVSTNAANNFSILAPRQQVTPTPYALVAGSASGLLGLTIQQYSSGTPNLIVGADNFIAPGTFGATIDGGTNNSIAATWSGVGGGYGNSIAAGAYVSFLGGGIGNIISNNAYYSVIGGGQNNIIQVNDDHAFIGGGSGNVIQGGFQGANTIGANFSSIVGGQLNYIGPNSINSIIGGGYGNILGEVITPDIRSAQGSVLVGGESNLILANFSFLGGGVGNNILVSAGENTLVGGQANTINSGAQQSFLGGGNNNNISVNANYDVLVGGQRNIVGGDDSTVGGGYQNYATNSYATVPGGSNNIASGVSSAM